MPQIDLSILNQRQTPAFYADIFANRPAAGFVGRIFVSTDTFAFYRDNGTGWDLIGGPGTGTITGSGAAGRVAIWDGASSISSDSGFTFTTVDNAITAGKYIVSGGTSSQFLKGDGSLDSSAYVTTNIYNGNGTLSAERTVSLNNFNLIFDGGATTARVRLDADTNVARIFSFATNNLPRFAIRVDGTESGGNTGSDYAIRRYDDAGTFVDAPLTITRSTGQSTFAKKVVIENNAGDQQLQIVSTTAPSIRLDNAQTGATKRAGFGISTATNNFIQGSADLDFCMFNGSTTASPILFGVYDAAAVNVQEAARISAARNFLIGTTTDAGEKLQVNGTAYINGLFTVNNSDIYSQNGSGTNLSIGFKQSSAIKFRLRYDISQDFLSMVGSTGNFIQTWLQSGLVGIGTTSPTVASGIGLVLNGQAAQTRLAFKNNYTGDTSTDGVQLALISGSSAFVFQNRESDGYFAFEINANEVFRTSGTNLLIGTTTDAGQKLQVNGNAAITGQFSAIQSVSTDYIATFQNTNANSYGVIIKSAASPNNAYPLLAVTDSAGSVPYLRVDSGTGNVSIGTNPGANSSLRIAGLPTSPAGLASGEVWNNLGVLSIV